MNKIRFSFFAAGAALALAASGLHAQTSIQNLTFSLIGDFQTNTFTTNTSGGTPVSTNEVLVVRPILFTTANVVKAIAVDLEGTNWDLEGTDSTNWNGARLVREVNLTNGAEGIFLRNGTNQINVSRYFGTSFTNNFTGYLSNYLVLVTNGFTNSFTNSSTTNFANSFPLQAAIIGGKISFDTDTGTNTTNYKSSAGLYTLSFFSSNVQFNTFGFGSGAIANVGGDIDGTHYERLINSEVIGVAGASFYLNTTTNIFDLGANLPTYIGGPLHGTITTGAGYFSDISGP
jgi:hypothetical protein